MAKRTILLDVDTGIDDALAILYAVAHPELEVAGISCVTGNAHVTQVVANTLKTLDAAGAPEIPVAAGAMRPLVERSQPAEAFHGAEGALVLPDSVRTTFPGSAVSPGGVPVRDNRATTQGLLGTPAHWCC